MTDSLLLTAVKDYFHWSRVFAQAQAATEPDAAALVPIAMPQALAARDRVLSVGNQEAGGLTQRGGNADALREFLALVNLGGPFAEREPQLRAAWARASATLVPATHGDAFLSPRDLAAKHGVNAENLRKRLDRWRYSHDAGYMEAANRRPKEARYLYSETAVQPVIDAMKRGRQTSGEK